MHNYDHHAEFFIAGVPKERPRVGPRTITPKKTKNFESSLQILLARWWGKEFLECPVRIKLEFQFKAPKTSKTGYPRADVDNLEKAFCDACNKIIWRDDCQVVESTVKKKYGEHDSIKFWLGEALIVSDVFRQRPSGSYVRKRS